jgi:hypothetical protein
MVGGAVENQENILPGKFPRQDVEDFSRIPSQRFSLGLSSLKSIDAVRAKLKQAILYIEYRQITLMWKWYQTLTGGPAPRFAW